MSKWVSCRENHKDFSGCDNCAERFLCWTESTKISAEEFIDVLNRYIVSSRDVDLMKLLEQWRRSKDVKNDSKV